MDFARSEQIWGRYNYIARRESNQPSQSTVISIAAGVIDFFDYVFDYVIIYKISVSSKSKKSFLLITLAQTP